MDEKYILVSLEEEKTKRIAESIKSKTAIKILDLLSEGEFSETDIANKLRSPVNTIEYNLKKLLQAGLIEKSKAYFWSEKGKKIPLYKIVKKFIIISPKTKNKTSGSKTLSKLKSIIPVVAILGIFSLIIKYYFEISAGNMFADGSVKTQISEKIAEDAVAGVASSVPAGSLGTVGVGTFQSFQAILQSQFWLWFLGGAIIAIIILVAINWKKL